MKTFLVVILFFSFSFIGIAQTENANNILIKDSTNYSKDFLHCLAQLNDQEYELVDNFVISNSGDTVIFPKLSSKKVTFENKESSCSLTLEQLNFTTIKYMYNSTEQCFEGLATLNCTFYLASESDIDDNGEMYFCDEYFDYHTNNFLSIRVGDNFCKISNNYYESPLLVFKSI